jgi:glycosyltransferase involved in cell wall biosynthesis
MGSGANSKISVALCTYNGASYLEEQLESIAQQTLLPCEIVLCDDGSSDDTAAIVARFAARAPFAVRWHENPKNLGPTDNFTQAISLCLGDLIALSDQDDRWHPEKLERFSLILKDDSVGGVFSDARLIDADGNLLHDRLWQRVNFAIDGLWQDLQAETLLRRNVVTGATMLLRARLIPAFLPIGSSWIHDAWFSWMLVLHSRLVALAEPLTDYRIHPSQQIGACQAYSWRKRLSVARTEGEAHYQMLLARFGQLQQHLVQSGSTRELAAISRKIHHLEHRAHLPSQRIARLQAILRELRNYRDFSRGLRAAAKDLFI